MDFDSHVLVVSQQWNVLHYRAMESTHPVINHTCHVTNMTETD